MGYLIRFLLYDMNPTYDFLYSPWTIWEVDTWHEFRFNLFVKKRNLHKFLLSSENLNTFFSR